ncbi:Uma2 family endonuclease [Pendulispora albinea]|uniref:Uma2 family endonuclease n=1 Tax=Pendulispora albinea TaxID=2741071 RepID=A0ABZ2LK52_9BACT
MNTARPVFDPTAPNDPEVEAAFEAAPPEVVAELLDGQLYTSPRPRPRHARTKTRLVSLLGRSFDAGIDGPGGWVMLVEPELHLGPKPDKVVPDLAGWHRDRLPSTVFDEGAPAGIRIRPDWVCEILSDSTVQLDRGKKMRIYRREGVGHLWLLSPKLELLEVYRLERETWVLLDTYEAEVRAEPFDSIDLPLSALWAE